MIVSQPAFATSGRHDPWPSHAYYFHGAQIFMTASGRFCADFQFALVHPNTNFDYIVKWFDSYDEGAAWLASYVNFTTADGWTGFYGEWYNYVVRSLAFDKIPDTEMYAWLASH